VRSNGGMMIIRAKLKKSGRNLFQVHVVHNERNWKSLGTEPGYPPWEASVWPPELWNDSWWRVFGNIAYFRMSDVWIILTDRTKIKLTRQL
jgi:hypothetical protein